MRRRPSRAGFTIIELVISMSISSLVLIGVIGVASQMVRFQMEGSRKGGVTGWTLISLSKMNMELENATSLYCPGTGASHTCTGGLSTAYLSGCTNYSRDLGSRIDAASNNTSFYYCVAAAGTPATMSLLRYELTGAGVACPMPAPAACGTTTPFEVYARDFYPIDPLTPFFRRADDVSGVELNYIVGIATPTTNTPNPVYMKVTTKIGMNKNYTAVAD
ncbi:MAG: prepilin-type N-terminal cleavage/methylation domain-containing protein [Elusimicrobiota bacterium]